MIKRVSARARVRACVCVCVHARALARISLCTKTEEGGRRRGAERMKTLYKNEQSAAVLSSCLGLI